MPPTSKELEAHIAFGLCVRPCLCPFVTLFDACHILHAMHARLSKSHMSRLVTKPTKCAPSEDSDQPGHPPSLIRVFAVRMMKAWTLNYPLSTQRRLWSDWADAQVDLSLCWAHSHIVGFVTRRLIYRFLTEQQLTRIVFFSELCPFLELCSFNNQTAVL